MKEEKLIPEYADLMTMKNFVWFCKSGAFIDYDGHGNYANETHITGGVIKPSDVMSDKYDKAQTHVAWYNR